MGKMVPMCLLLAAAGLLMSAAGFQAVDPHERMYKLRALGPVLLGGAVALLGVRLALGKRD